MTPPRRFRRGVAAIEFALVLPVLLLLLFAIFDWSIYLYERMNVGVVANRAVRLAAGSATPGDDAETIVCATLPRYALACTADTVSSTVVARASGTALDVRVSVPFDAPVGLVPTPGAVVVTATTQLYGLEP